MAHIAQQLSDEGRYLEAARRLEERPPVTTADQILLAEVLEGLGRVQAAKAAVEGTRRSDLSESDRSRTEFVLSRVAADMGDFQSELYHLKRSIAHAEHSGNLRQLCWSQLRLMALVSDRSGEDSAGELVATVRNSVTKLGDATMTAALHLFVAELDGKRGRVDSAIKHTEISHSLLQRAEHAWLEAWVHNNFLALYMMRNDYERATMAGAVAMKKSAECGAVSAIRRCQGNLGRLSYLIGDYNAARDHVEHALSHSPLGGEQINAALETQARILLAEGRISEGYAVAHAIDVATQAPNGTGRYVHRYSLLTKAELLGRLGRLNEAVEAFSRCEALAVEAADRGLALQAKLLRAEFSRMQGSDRSYAQAAAWTECSAVQYEFIELFALFERATGFSLSASGMRDLAEAHFRRSIRTLSALRNVPGVLEVRRSQEKAGDAVPAAVQGLPVGPVRALEVVNDLAALVMHRGRPELMADDIKAVLASLQCATGTRVTTREDGGQPEVLAADGEAPAGDGRRTLTLGTSDGREIGLEVQARTDVASQAVINSIALIVHAVRDLEAARVEREQRLTLWPTEHLPSDTESVVTGDMERLMAVARKVAQADISVLLTGESGTGKEVLARAIHGFSLRGKRPFVPFNCTAVPRELLESQLFGYRRGAFTGADRDHPGLIRAAKGGTLFLDEVGDLSPELQPKLLRFLESGEINPLGETTPFNVDVRVIAATNADLMQLVKAGRFREDLYYRLDVVRLELPPLRDRRDEIPSLVHHFVNKAASDLRKGRLRIAEETMEHLLLFDWPGNVRQLQNEIRRMVALADNDAVVDPSMLSRGIRDETDPAVRAKHAGQLAVSLSEKLGPTVDRIEREMIRAALAASAGKLEPAAKALGISRKGLYLKRQRLGI